MLAEARELVEVNGFHAAPAIVLAHTGWHAGVIGIVASRLADIYARPSLLVALPAGPAAEKDAEHIGVGSGRSIAGFALNEALEACTDLLIGHGGHAMAAGFRLRSKNLKAFRERLCGHTAKHFPAAGPPPPILILDVETPLSTLTPGLLRDLDRLEPYGAENRKPMFLAGNLEVVGEPRRVGTPDRHLSFRVRQNGLGDTVLKAIAFGMADRIVELMSASGRCCLAFTPKVNEWQGRRSVDLVVTDFQAGAEARLE
jgi:single-stranded-DNA-specific exonuclease